MNPKALSKEGHDNSLPKHRVTILEDVHVELVHAHIHQLQAPQVPKCLHPAPVSSLPHLAELTHLDHSEKPLCVFDLVHEHVHCCARIEVTPRILYSREADLDSEEPASNFVHRGGARKDSGFDLPLFF